VTDNTRDLILNALGNIATRPADDSYLGRGDGSGVIVADVSKRLLYYFSPNQPTATAPLLESISILPYIGVHPELEGMRIRMGFPPENRTVLHITGIASGQGLNSVGGITPQEQLEAAKKYTDVGSLINLRIAPNDPADTECYINPGWYKDASGNPAFWAGDTTGTITAAIAALSSGEHQMAAVYIDTTTGEPDIVTNAAETGGVNDKQLFDTTTIEDMTHAAGETLVGAVHLYDGQTSITEVDIYRSADPRIIFDSTGSGAGMTDFTVAADSGTPQTISNGNTLSILTGAGLNSVASATDTVTINLDATPAPVGATYIVQTADATLTNEQAMGALATGIVKNTTATGVLSIAAADVDYATPALINLLSAKNTVRVASAAALPACTYNNGSSGVGATLTGNAVGVLTVDGNNIVLNDRVLINHQASQQHNGIYSCTTEGTAGVAFVLTRVPEADSSAEILGSFVLTVYRNEGYVCQNTSAITVGTTILSWIKFTGANQQLTNLLTTAINASLLPDNDNSYDIGSAGNKWREFFGNAVTYEERTAPSAPTGGNYPTYVKLVGGTAALFGMDDAGVEKQIGQSIAILWDQKTTTTAGASAIFLTASSPASVGIDTWRAIIFISRPIAERMDSFFTPAARMNTIIAFAISFVSMPVAIIFAVSSASAGRVDMLVSIMSRRVP